MMDLLCDRDRRGGSITRIINHDGSQIPVVSDDIPCPTAQDVVVSRVGAVQPMETVAPLSSVVLDDFRQSCSDSEASDDDLSSVGALVPMNRPAVCCARLDDFDWVVPDCVPNIYLSGRDIEVGLTDLTHDLQVLPDVFPFVPAGAATVPMPLPVVAESESHVVIRKETAPVVVPLAEEMTLRVGMVGLIEDGSDLPAELLGSERVLPDRCFIDVGVLVPERSPVVSARAEVGTVTAWVSVLLDAGSQLPVVSDMSVWRLWMKLWITPWMWLVCMLDSCGSRRIRRVFCH